MAENTTTLVDRPFPRLSKQGKIDFKVIDNPKDDLAAAGVPESQVQNICGGGIRFPCQEPIVPGTFLAVRIRLPDLPDAIIALGRVVGSDPVPIGGNRSELAVEFFWTGWGAPEVESAIHQYIAGRV